MDYYPLHLAMAALVGACLVGISAYYAHRKTLDQLLEFVERERDRDRQEEDDRRNPTKRGGGDMNRQRRRRYYRGGSASLPDVAAVAVAEEEIEEVEEVARFPVNGQIVDLGIPAGLPRLHTVPEGNYLLDRFLAELLIE